MKRSLAARRPRLYYGWVIVLTLSLTELVSWGIVYYAFAVFLKPMERDLGWSRAELTGAFSLSLLVAGLAALPVGRWIDRHGTRLLMTAGSCAGALLVFAWSRVSSLPALYAIWAGLGIVGAAVLYEPAFATVAVWFRRRRHGALTVVTLFGGLASVIFLPLTHRLVEACGWRQALEILALVLAVATVPLHALLLRRRPADLGLEPDGEVREEEHARQEPAGIAPRVALRSLTFWCLALAFVLSSFSINAVLVHLIPYLVERGFDDAFAAGAAGLIGGMQIPGRALFAPISARAPRRWVTAAIFLVQTAALGLLPWVAGKGSVYLFVVLFGMGNGMVTLARASRVAEIFGTAYYATLAGALALCITLGRALGPVGAAWLYEGLGRYELVFGLLAGASALAAVSGFAAEARVNRVGGPARS